MPIRELPSMTENEQLLARRAWETDHLRNGDPATGARDSQTHLTLMGPVDWKSDHKRRAIAEFALLTVELSRIAATNSLQPLVIIQHLERAIETIVAYFPVGQTEDHARQRTPYWEGIYGPDHDTHLKILSAVQRVTQELAIVTTDDRVGKLATSLGRLESELATKTTGIAEQASIVLAKGADRAAVQAAFVQYRDDRLPVAAAQNPHEAAAILSTATLSLFRHGALSEAIQALRLLGTLPKRTISVSLPKIALHKTVAGVRELIVRRRARNLTREQQVDAALLEQFLAIGYVGISAAEVSPLQSSQGEISLQDK